MEEENDEENKISNETLEQVEVQMRKNPKCQEIIEKIIKILLKTVDKVLSF
jgi:hypothetical protein